ncbi:MAG: acyclic terpene utilization AtuA family protein [Acidobacteriota bacterium]
MIRIGNGQGFWGDWLEAPVRLVRGGPLDYLTLDYLAEVTMSVLQKQRQKNPALGYARDFPPLMARLAGDLEERGVRVIANAGGVNPLACAREVRRAAPGLKVAAVLGDDVLGRIDVSAVPGPVLSANAYLGAFPIAEALATGADVVITGRCADAALALAPMIHSFGWREDAWDLLAAGVAAGHIVECGAQCTGGNCQADWQSIPDLANIGYPIVEAEPDGVCTITKHAGTGGRVNIATVAEQLVYEVGDPRRYITPDVVADFTSLRLEDAGPDRVRVSGARGAPRTASLKVSVNYPAGWKATGTLVYSWPQALEKARCADRIVRERLAGLGLCFDAIETEFFGVNACHGPAAAPADDPPEVQLRIGVRGQDRDAVERFTREVVPLVLSGPPGATGYGEGRPQVREVVAYWPVLIPREEVKPRVEVVE